MTRVPVGVGRGLGSPHATWCHRLLPRNQALAPATVTPRLICPPHDPTPPGTCLPPAPHNPAHLVTLLDRRGSPMLLPDIGSGSSPARPPLPARGAQEPVTPRARNQGSGHAPPPRAGSSGAGGGDLRVGEAGRRCEPGGTKGAGTCEAGGDSNRSGTWGPRTPPSFLPGRSR